jgi:hypothetical protein
VGVAVFCAAVAAIVAWRGDYGLAALAAILAALNAAIAAALLARHP